MARTIIAHFLLPSKDVSLTQFYLALKQYHGALPAPSVHSPHTSLCYIYARLAVDRDSARKMHGLDTVWKMPFTEFILALNHS